MSKKKKRKLTIKNYICILLTILYLDEKKKMNEKVRFALMYCIRASESVRFWAKTDFLTNTLMTNVDFNEVKKMYT